MVVDKLFEFIEDIERFCVNHRWSRFFNDWETGDEALDEYAMIYKNCCNDVDEEKDAANDIFTELTEYMDCLYNYIDVDYVKLLDDEKQNARKWLDKVEKVIGSCVFSLKGNDLKGFLIKGYQMCHLIKEAAVKTPDEYYGGRRTDVMPYYIGENKNQLFNNILNEDNMGKLNEKRIELSSLYPVKINDIIDLVNRSNRLICKEIDNKTIQLYIYTRKRDEHDAFAEVEITSAGYILHGDEGYDYQGTSIKEFNNDLNEVIVHYDFDVFPKKFGENIINKEKLFEAILFEDYKGPILLGAAALGLGTLSIADHNKIKSTADKLGIELAETEYGSHEAAGLIYPIYEYKYDMKGPMNIDSLCKYLKDNTNFDEITYDDEGDHYVINYIDNYTIHQKVGNATVSKHRTSEGNLNLPKNYFDFSFVLDESYNKNAKPSVIKESLTFDDTIRRCVHIESEEDLEDSPFTYYLDVDIGDTVYICEDADVYMREDKNGWVIFWHNKFMEHIPLSLLDRDDEEACNAKYRQAQNRYKAICNAALDGTLEKEFLPKNGKPSFDHSNAAEVFKQFGENKINKNQLFESLLQVER